jgi:molybdopterin-biosynthesis enzyme MoeA-like protein
MKGIFQGPLQPLLRQFFGQATYRERAVLLHCPDESVIAADLERIVKAHPEVYIKSRAERFGPDVKLRVTFSATGQDPEDVEQAIAAAMDDFRAAMKTLGLETEALET